MSIAMEQDIKRWTAKRKSALVLDIIQGKTTVAEASRAYDLSPSEVESWVEDGKSGMENALRAKPHDVREQYERQVKDLQEAYGEAMLDYELEKIIETLCHGLKEDGFHVSTRHPSLHKTTVLKAYCTFKGLHGTNLADVSPCSFVVGDNVVVRPIGGDITLNTIDVTK